MLIGDVGEAMGNVGAAGETDALDLGADCRQCRAGLAAAIEDSAEAGLGDGLARCRNQCPEPAGSCVNAGFGSARKNDWVAGPSRGSQRADGVGERVDDDDDGAGKLAAWAF